MANFQCGMCGSRAVISGMRGPKCGECGTECASFDYRQDRLQCPGCEEEFPDNHDWYMDDRLGDETEYCSEKCHQGASENAADRAHDMAKGN